jgi:uracil-DNA glycosylase family 4
MSALNELADTIESCTKCPLHKNRKFTVSGEGPIDATMMFVGEAPGRQEDKTGRPFVGKAGLLLNHALAKAGISRLKIFITNVVKCRPPNNRNPHQAEIAACYPYLFQQISIIQPRILCTMGLVAAKHLLPGYGIKPSSMSQMHGHLFQQEGLPRYVVPLYHPAAIIYNPLLAEIFLADLKKINAKIDQENEYTY